MSAVSTILCGMTCTKVIDTKLCLVKNALSFTDDSVLLLLLQYGQLLIT